jgi:hypothetical protein
MDELLDRLEGIVAGMPGTVDPRVLEGASQREIVRLLQAAGALARRAEALVVGVAEHVEERSSTVDRDERLTTRLGCRSTGELIERTVRCDGHRAALFVRAARVVMQPVELTTGERLPGRFPALRACLAEGVVGLDGLLSATRPLLELDTRLGAADRERADAYLATAARGEAEGEVADSWLVTAAPGFPATADDLRLFARAIADRVDPDGPAPDDDGATRGRSLRLGRAWRGLVPLHGQLVPEVAAQLVRLFDSILNPRAQEKVAFRSDGEDAPDEGRDPRTRPQQQHDAFATALTAAAASGEVPSLGGAAPTLVVTVSAEEYARGTGHGTVEGIDAPVSMHAVRHTACGGTIQRVLFDAGGRIRQIGTTERIFTVWQRRAIGARDRECLIPGCHVPATWCEVHHVQEHVRGGPTHTDNGVLLCWHHHRTLEVGGWEIRMRDGVPEIRAPQWWDPLRRWRSARPRVIPRATG